MKTFNGIAYKGGLNISEVKSVPFAILKDWVKDISMNPYNAESFELSESESFNKFSSMSELLENIKTIN
jgi:hypothetical protein